MRMRNAVLTGAAGLLLLVCVSRAWAGEAEAVRPKADVDKIDAAKGPANWEDDLRKKLSRKVSFEFVDTPIVEALAFFRSLTNVNMILDPKAIEKGLDAKAITLRVTDMDLKTAMDWACLVAGLVCQPRDQAIFVTFAEERHETDEGLSVYRLRKGLPEGLTAEKLKDLSAVAAPKARVAYDVDLKLLVIACDDPKDLRRVEALLKVLGIDTEADREKKPVAAPPAPPAPVPPPAPAPEAPQKPAKDF
jgi:hypothetical protein